MNTVGLVSSIVTCVACLTIMILNADEFWKILKSFITGSKK